MAIPEFQKAAVLLEQFTNPPRFEIRQIPVPSPGPNEILVKMSVTAVCSSDYGMAIGHLGPVGDVLGHEGVGRVVAVGANASYLAGEEVSMGRRVAIGLLRDLCGHCGFCMSDQKREGETRCLAKTFSGTKLDGTFAQYALVRARYAQLLPASLDDVPDEEVAPVMCAGVTAYKAVRSCGLRPGQWLAVSGAGGGVGAFAAAFGRAMGYRVIGVDVGPEKGNIALEHGAEAYVDAAGSRPGGGGVTEEVMRLTGGSGANAVVVAVGSAAAYQAALGMLAPFGTLMCAGIPPPEATVSFHPINFISTGIRVVGLLVGTRADVLEALDFVKRRLVVPRVQWARLEDMERLILEVGKGQVQGKYVIKLDDNLDHVPA